MGFCFGVSHIDKLADQALQGGKKTYSYGPLVHNPTYVKRREEEGIGVLDNIDQAESLLDSHCQVILRAHGVERESRERLEKTGAHIIDGTCPILQKVYRLAGEKNREGRQLVIVGDPDHPEVKALRSYLEEDTAVISSPDEARVFQASRPLFVLSQTTNRSEFFQSVLSALKEKNPDLEYRETICSASRERQEGAAELAREADAMVVIGGRNSSNTEKLAQVSRKYCPQVYKVEGFDDLSLQKLADMNIIGITAGASTPDWIIEEVIIGMENMSKEDFMEAIEDSMVKIYPKDIVKGTIIAVKPDEVYVDINFRSDGIIKTDEMSDEEKADPQKAFQAGEEVDVYVVKMDDGEGNVVLSTSRVQGLKNWNKLVEMSEAGEKVTAKVTGSNRGGLMVSIMGINGFIPASQITTYYVKNFRQFVGQELECKVISMDDRKKRVVLSSRAVKDEELDKVWEKIVPDQTIKGKVVRMTDFGAFVDLGGVDGLIHVSDISWQHVDKPSDVLSIGQEVEPLVLKANRERNRISLGLKQLTPKPFEVFMQNNKEGDVVSGEVVNLVDFGVFIRLKEGVEGLVHISEIANHHIDKPADVLTVGQEVQVKILSIDTERQRIALSIRALEKPEKKVAPVENHPQPQQEERKPRPRKRPLKKASQQPAYSSAEGTGTNLGDLIEMTMGQLGGSDALKEEAAEEAAEPAEAVEPQDAAEAEQPAEAENQTEAGEEAAAEAEESTEEAGEPAEEAEE